MTRIPRSSIVVRIPEDMLERLKGEATARDVSVNFLMNKAVKLLLENLRPLSDEC